LHNPVDPAGAPAGACAAAIPDESTLATTTEIIAMRKNMEIPRY
jgi:hypothetical protein